MLEDNKVYRMELCGDIKDGFLNDWETIERCVGVKKIGNSNFTCGSSRTLQRRICSRSLGGKYCRDETGAVVENDVMVRTVPCEDVECPGKNNHDKVMYNYNYQLFRMGKCRRVHCRRKPGFRDKKANIVV